MLWFSLYLTYSLIGWGIRLAMVTVVLRRQFAPGASLAWLGIVFLHPYIGLTLYLLVGESRLGPRRAQQHRDIISRVRNPDAHSPREVHHAQPDSKPIYEPMILQAQKISGLPVLGGNDIEFFPDTLDFRARLIADIDSAKTSVHLLYYMFVEDQTGRAIADAVIRAAGRGVKCRLLFDALASRVFFRHGELHRSLQAAGVQIAAALPVSPLRRHFARMDLRNHRKLAIIDGKIAFAGSHNLVDADYGGRRGSPWFDVTGRFTGPVVGELASVFAEDWDFETGEELEIPYPDEHPQSAGTECAEVQAQVVPTGPSTPDATYRRLLLAAVQSAQEQLILTTPYFVPDETTLLELMMAADRGVDVKLIVPASPDHFFAAAAGRAHFQSLLRSGVSIFLYKPGLLHAKTTTVDDAFALFGSANLDVRSFSLNFELSILLYGKQITQRLRKVQENYLAGSEKLNPDTWQQRPQWVQYSERAVSLLSPLL